MSYTICWIGLSWCVTLPLVILLVGVPGLLSYEKALENLK